MAYIEKAIGAIFLERNRARVTELLDDEETIDVISQFKFLEIGNKILNNIKQLLTAKRYEAGNLVTSRKDLEDFYSWTYQARLTPNGTPVNLEAQKS